MTHVLLTPAVSATAVFTTGTLDLPCSGADADLFFSAVPAELERAKALCASCPLRADCLDGAKRREEPWGVWGGVIFENGTPIAKKRGRGRPRKSEIAAA